MHKTTVVVGDLHGREEYVRYVLREYGSQSNIVFLGDYVDSYDRSSGDCLATLLMVLEAQREMSNVTALMGNHERQYIYANERCSGYRLSLADMLNITGLVDRMRWELKSYHLIKQNGKRYLCTHAGISAQHMKQQQPSYDDCIHFAKSKDALGVGRARGGRNMIGGVFWCDFNQEFEPIEGIQQIFGHTHFGDGAIRKKGTNYAIDCLTNQGGEFLFIDKNGDADALPVEIPKSLDFGQ